ncbi:PQQ-binding-like beta-propeller repeat protein [Natrinema caseinilyticum]|uniref:PQQ-binding-like beta-propeller repeat protein n=1 Tax=Natrinema caseinilyticum TaxID=2961570 RepID=UPI0020C31559|nr:PQQ-binding-like beta-propeller repeat protein [Natrinema caseinilyticum]
MTDWHRRSVLATGAALTAGSGVASTGVGETGSAGESVDGLPDPALQPNPEMDEDWASYAGGAGHARYVTDGYEFDGDVLESAWSADHSGTVAVADETVYTSTEAGVVALDATDGAVVWENTDVDARNPSVVGDTVYLGADQVVALDRSDGSVRWESDFDTDGSVTHHTVAYDAVFVVADGTLYALEAADGSVRWTIESVAVESPDAAEPEEYEFITSPAAANGVVYVGTAGVALAVEPESGDEVWRNALEFVATGTRARATTTRAVLGRFSQAEAGIMDAQTGDALTLGVSEGVDIALGESVFISGDDYTFFGLSLDKPFDQLWEKSFPHTGARPVISGETAYVYFVPRPGGTEGDGDYSDELVALNKRDGTEKWSLSADDVPVGTIRAISGETIYVSRDGKLVALRAPANGDGGDGGSGSGGDGSGDGGGETAGDGNDSSGSESSGDGDGTESGSTDSEGPDSADDVPGFTSGTGILGGAVALEWLRRRTGADDPDEYR